MLTKDSILKINDWNQKAEDEDVKYIYDNIDINNIKNFKKFLILGRKGTGKTAIRRYLEKDLSLEKSKVITLSFDDFSLDYLQALSNNGIGIGNARQSKYYWELIIYSSIFKDDDCICDPIVKTIMEKIYPVAKRKLPFHIRNINLNILNCGFNIEIENKEQHFTLENIIYSMKSYYYQNIECFGKVYVLFDRLDAEYNFTVENKLYETIYTGLLTSLINAVYGIRREYSEYKLLNCVVFLRDDIHEKLNDSHKAAWDNETITLNWSPGDLQRLLTHKLSVVFNKKFKCFEDAWAEVCAPEQAAKIFKDMCFYTQLRPRDFIMYMQIVVNRIKEKNFSNENFAKQIEIDDIKHEAARKYSCMLRQHIVDETIPVQKDINDIMTILDRLDCRVFSLNEFQNCFKDYCKKNNCDTEYLLRLLFNCNIIGIKRNMNEHFRYAYNGMRFDSREGYVYGLHEGLIKSIIVK